VSPFRRIVPLAVATALAGCLASPQVKVQEPTSTRPAAAPQPRPSGGAIFHAASYRPLFEDRRARYAGDTLTVVLNEKISASQKSATSASRSGSVAVDIPTANVPLVNNVPVVKGYLNRVPGTEIQGSGSARSDGKGESSSSNLFSGTITVTVVEVLPNGNLVVSGEKQIGTNREKETLRFSGVVNPAHIVAGNTVSSTQVADARLDYRGEGAIDSAQVAGWLARFFLSFLPF
jgi:flagellar L-ring protein precursor FlgH